MTTRAGFDVVVVMLYDEGNFDRSVAKMSARVNAGDPPPFSHTSHVHSFGLGLLTSADSWGDTQETKRLKVKMQTYVMELGFDVGTDEAMVCSPP